MLAVALGLLGLCAGYILGVERGMKLDRVGTLLPSAPTVLRSFGRKAKHVPKSVSDYNQWKKEQTEAPRDPE